MKKIINTSLLLILLAFSVSQAETRTEESNDFHEDVFVRHENDEHKDALKDAKRIFTKSRKKDVQIWLTNLDRHLPLIKGLFALKGVPEQLAYLPLIESGGSNFSVSPAGAVGLWQFIEGTGKRYGLRIDKYVDERRDPRKSTLAAADYMLDLYEMLGDWTHVMMSYNCGENRIVRWTQKVSNVYRSKYLPDETRQYVPNFIWGYEVANNREKYGYRPAVEPDAPETDIVTVSAKKGVKIVSIKALAKRYGMSVKQFIGLNPALLTSEVPVGHNVTIIKQSD